MQESPRLPFEALGPDRLVHKQGGGCIGLFGLPFLLAGLFVLSMSTGLLRVENADQIPIVAKLMMFVLGVIFTGVGAALVFGRGHTVIDRKEAIIWKHWMVIRPVKNHYYRLSDYDTLLIRRNEGDSDSPDTYSILMRRHDRAAELELCKLTDFGIIYEQAIVLRNFLAFDLEDHSSKHIIDLGKTISPERARPMMPVPDEYREISTDLPEIVHGTDYLSIAYNSPGQNIRKIIGAFFAMGVFWFFSGPILNLMFSTNTPNFIRYIFASLVIFANILMPIRALLRKKDKHILILRKESIEIVNRRKTQKINLGDILSIDYETRTGRIEEANTYDPKYGKLLKSLSKWGYTKGIVFKTKKGFFYFGSCTSDEQITAIYQNIYGYLSNAIE